MKKKIDKKSKIKSRIVEDNVEAEMWEKRMI